MSTSLRKGISVLLAGTIAMTCMMGAMAAIGPISRSENIPYNVLQEQFRGTLQIGGIGAVELGSSGSCGENATYVLDMDGTLTISGTGAIEYYDFQNSTSIKKVIIEEGITSIGDYAFQGCKNLTSVTLPQSLTNIGNWAFYNCGFTSVTLPEGLTSIGDSAFQGCSNLTEINIPDSVTSIGSYAFQACGFTSVTLPEGLTSIGDGLFQSCSSLTEINIPNSVTNIGDCAFYGCSNLNSITIPNKVNSIGSDAFRNCENLKSISLPDGITTISQNTFWGCSNLTSVNLPQNLISIGQFAFQNCGLTSITIPDRVTTIGEFAFDNSSKLTEINGGEGLTDIGNRAFYAGMYYLKTNLNTSNEYFKNYDWLEDGREITISSTPGPGDSDQSCGEDATFREEGTTVTITGSGAIADEAFKDNSTITEVVIEEGITEIGNSSFKNMASLESVKIPDSVTNIGDSAFAETPNLSLVEGGSNATIANNAFTSSTSNSTIMTDNENIYNNISTNTDRNVQLTSSNPITPVGENWDYNGEQGSFATDKVQNPSVESDINSLTDPDATVEGLDEKQGLKSEYETADASSEETLVAVTKASDFIVAVPKVLIMDGNGEQSTAEYKISVFGHVDPAKRVTVTPEASFEMVNQGKADVVYTAQVSQPETGINGIDILEDPSDEGTQYLTGTITANLKRAGSYKGTMNFTIDYVDYVE